MRPFLILLSSTLLALPAAAQHAVQSRDGELAIVAGEHGPRVTDRKGFSNPLLVPDEVRLQSLAPIRSGWIAAGDQPVGGRTELYLRMLDAGGLKRLPTPRFQEHAIRTQPVILTREGSIVALAWLEGPSRDAFQVKASHWLGITWSRPLEITGSDDAAALALDATLLEDGSWLLAWAGYDGQDDEIFWSLVVDSSFTEPLALTANDVPDIVPSVTAAGQGALLAWNQYDGEEYRVVVTELSEGRWTEPQEEPRGTFHPFFTLQDGMPTLLYYDYADGAGVWRLHELGEEAQAVRRGRVAAPNNQRPLVRKVDGVTRLEWPTSAERRPVVWEEEP